MSRRHSHKPDHHTQAQAMHLKRLYWSSEKKRLRELKVPSRHPEFLPDASRCLEVVYDCPDDDFKFKALSVWQRRDGFWRCVEAAPVIRWMVGKEPAAAKLELARRGCSWQWISEVPPLSEGETAGVSTSEQGVGYAGKFPIRPNNQMALAGHLGEGAGPG